ncbi:MAG: hypothetical protein LDL41_17450 [Coleofasciculus sp. S288]|nr:hypothetical protein [Coleofasciculus sp. S288]
MVECIPQTERLTPTTGFRNTARKVFEREFSFRRNPELQWGLFKQDIGFSVEMTTVRLLNYCLYCLAEMMRL